MEEKSLLNLTSTDYEPRDVLTSTEIATKHPDVLNVYRATGLLNGLIIVLGFVTNSLILIILGRKRIGSQTTRIILTFLAVNDFIVMIVETFVHFIPYYTQWFPVFFTHIGCGIAFASQASIITTSSWYIVLMTLERFTVVWFPIKAKIFCTQKKILVACIVIPIVVYLSFCYFIADFELSGPPGSGYVSCDPKDALNANNGKGFRNRIFAWIMLYFYIPALFIVLLNLTIVIRLTQASRLQKLIRTKSQTACIQQDTSTGGKRQSVISRLSRKLSRKDSRSLSSIKKATTLVIAASVAFIIMMIPRGVSVAISLDVSWDYRTPALDILDTVAYLLQYLNHASNFFIYVLANNSFRKELLSMLRCGRKARRDRPAVIESTATNMTYVTKLPSPSFNYVSNPRTSNYVSNPRTSNSSLQEPTENQPLTETHDFEEN